MERGGQEEIEEAEENMEQIDERAPLIPSRSSGASSAAYAPPSLDYELVRDLTSPHMSLWSLSASSMQEYLV